jgi:dolichol-phosphate mannosyltransferase
MKLSIVIPAFNEEKTIGDVVKDCVKQSPGSEIIVVNDGSTDDTFKILYKLPVWIINNKKNLGHAKSLIKGLKEATGDYVFYTDADGQIKPSSLDFDFIMGYRVDRQDKFFRKVVSFILRVVIFLRHGYNIKDANCPFKVIRRSSLRFLLLHLPTNSVIPTISLSILVRKYGYRVWEVPVTHYPLQSPRKGFLQSLNKKSLEMFWNAFWEIMWL